MFAFIVVKFVGIYSPSYTITGAPGFTFALTTPSSLINDIFMAFY